MPDDRTAIITTHKFRWSARMTERRITMLLTGANLRSSARDELAKLKVPIWTRGVRVRNAGRFQFVVEATSWRGH